MLFSICWLHRRSLGSVLFKHSMCQKLLQHVQKYTISASYCTNMPLLQHFHNYYSNMTSMANINLMQHNGNDLLVLMNIHSHWLVGFLKLCHFYFLIKLAKDSLKALKSISFIKMGGKKTRWYPVLEIEHCDTIHPFIHALITPEPQCHEL